MSEGKREGDLYKEFEVGGKIFRVYYGYYDEIDRKSKYNDPIPIFPDFTASPEYTDGGEPLATMMQDACASYKGENKKTPDTTCADCKYFLRGEEWFGICRHPKNRKQCEYNDRK